MLESVSINYSASEPFGITAGVLAEALLFYGKVNLILDWGSLQELLRSIGPNALSHLLTEGYISTSFSSTTSGIQSEDGPIRRHRLVFFSYAGRKPGKIFTDRDLIQDAFRKNSGLGGGYRRDLEIFLEKTHTFDLSKAEVSGVFLSKDFFRHLSSKELLSNRLNIVIRELCMSEDIPSFRFELVGDESWFHIIHDCDFDALNRIYHQHTSPKHSNLSAEYLLANLYTSFSDMYFAGINGTELLTSRVSSRLMREQVSGLINRVDLRSNQLEKFLLAEFGNARALREAIDEGKASFSDFMKVLDQSRKFKEWLRDQNPNRELLEEYYKACTSGTWLDQLPGKTLRFFFFFGGAGLTAGAFLSPAAAAFGGLALTAFDTFLLGRLLGGWKPSQFVDQRLRPLVSPAPP